MTTELIHLNIPPPETDEYAQLVEDIALAVAELIISNPTTTTTTTTT